MAATVPTQPTLPVTSEAPYAPIFRVTHTICIDDVDLKFNRREEKTTEKFFCPLDPDQANFYLNLRFGVDYTNTLSAYVFPSSRDVTINIMKISIFSATGCSIGENPCKVSLDRLIPKGTGYGITVVPSCDSSTASLYKTWNIHLEFEYLGIVPAAQPPLTQLKSQLQSELLHLLHSGDQADVTFHVQGKKIVAHRVLLTTRCEYFRVMFDSGMAESASKEIEVPDIEPNVFQRLLDYIYSDVPPEYDGESTMALLGAADKYGMDNLKAMCETAICLHLNGENVIEALLTAEKHHCSALMERAVEVFRSYSSVLKTQEKWNKLLESPLLVLKLLGHSCD